ncbi:MAG: hypothetical protein JWO86_8286, partial [Myxococcaceae bacterium]|nr:hypothetical protein [Myxococcaceae bacterium]
GRRTLEERRCGDLVGASRDDADTEEEGQEQP